MNLLNFKKGKTYQRIGDSKYFKKEDKDYFTLNESNEWVKTTELGLNDSFKETKGDPGVKTLTDMYQAYKSGDAETQPRYRDMLLEHLARYVEELRSK